MFSAAIAGVVSDLKQMSPLEPIALGSILGHIIAFTFRVELI
jgi:hypothetical protein